MIPKTTAVMTVGTQVSSFQPLGDPERITLIPIDSRNSSDYSDGTRTKLRFHDGPQGAADNPPYEARNHWNEAFPANLAAHRRNRSAIRNVQAHGFACTSEGH